MTSRRQKAWNLYARLVQKPGLSFWRPVWLSRLVVDLSSRVVYRTPPGLRVRRQALVHGGGQVDAWHCDMGGSTARGTILYLHGGAFVIGGLSTYRHLVARLADAAGMDGMFVGYRMAPEHAFPAALDDAWTAWGALRDAGIAAGRIALVGDSAGGNLALALLHRIIAQGGPPPGAVAVMSPLTDLTGGSPSLSANRRSEMIVPYGWAKRSCESYARGADPRDPLLSPLFGRFDGAPPVLIHCARGELLLDDSLRMAEALRRQGVEVTLDQWDDVPHVWHINVGRSPEADRAVANMARFLRDTLDR